MVAPMAKREYMEELEASRGPGWSMRTKVRLFGGIFIILATSVIGIRAMSTSKEEQARKVANEPRQATIRISPEGAITWNGLGVTDLPAHAKAEHAKPGPLTIVVEAHAKAPAGSDLKLVETLKQAGIPAANVSINVSMEALRDLEGL